MGVEFEIEATVKLCKRGEAEVVKGSPFACMGYNSYTLFKVVDCCTMWDGKLVWLLEDDNTDQPAFTDGVDYQYFYLDEELEVVVEDTIKPTQSNLPDGWIPNKGKEPQFMIDGGVVDVLYNDGCVAYQITDDNRDGDNTNTKSAWRPSKSSSNNDEQPAKLPIEVTKTSTYIVKIKGHEFTLTEDEYYDLRSKLEDVE